MLCHSRSISKFLKTFESFSWKRLCETFYRGAVSTLSKRSFKKTSYFLQYQWIVCNGCSFNTISTMKTYFMSQFAHIIELLLKTGYIKYKEKKKSKIIRHTSVAIALVINRRIVTYCSHWRTCNYIVLGAQIYTWMNLVRG